MTDARAETRTARRRAATLLAALMLGAAVAHAQWTGFDADFDEEKKEWKEIEAKLPAYPRDADLLPVRGGASPHRFFVDQKSLSVGEDGVVRYTLVIKAAGGAVNVSFEGMRCELREQKYYAVGQAGGSWTRARNPQWRRIQSPSLQHNVLFDDYFCPDGGSRRDPPRNTGEIVQRFKYGLPTPPRDD